MLILKQIFRNVVCGLCEILDGSIRVLSLGFIHTQFTFTWLVYWERFEITKELENAKRDNTI